MTNEDIIENFAKQRINSRTKNVEWGNRTVSCNDNVLYSYNFQLAVYIGNKNGRPYFLVNTDHSSGSTSAHQSLAYKHCQGASFSFSKAKKLTGNQYFYNEIKPQDILFDVKKFNKDVVQDQHGVLHEYDYDENNKIVLTPLNLQGRFVPNSRKLAEPSAEISLKEIDFKQASGPKKKKKLEQFEQKLPKPKPVYRSIDEDFEVTEDEQILDHGLFVLDYDGCVLRYQKDFFLASTDYQEFNHRSFLVKLTKRPKSLEDAFLSLKPPQVIQAEKAGLTVRRLGKWFFVPFKPVTDEEKVLCLTLLTRPIVFDLGLPALGQKLYSCKALQVNNIAGLGNFDFKGRVFAKGRVTRKLFGANTGQPTLVLKTWHEAFPVNQKHE